MTDLQIQRYKRDKMYDMVIQNKLTYEYIEKSFFPLKLNRGKWRVESGPGRRRNCYSRKNRTEGQCDPLWMLSGIIRLKLKGKT